MTKQKYPRIGRIHKCGPLKGRCKICNNPAPDTIIEVQFNWFRGDDDVYGVHKGCLPQKPNKEAQETLKLLGYDWVESSDS